MVELCQQIEVLIIKKWVYKKERTKGRKDLFLNQNGILYIIRRIIIVNEIGQKVLKEMILV